MLKKITLILILLVWVNYFTTEGFMSIAASPSPQNIKIIRSLYSMDKDDIFIPQVSGMGNSELQAQLNNKLKQYLLSLKNNSLDRSLWGDFEVSFYNENLLGIHLTALSSMKREAHPEKIDMGIHLDLATGEIYELKSLFKAGIDYKGRIKELCLLNEPRYRLISKGQWDDWTYDIFARSWTGRNFLLSADYMRVYDSLNFATGYYSGYGIPYSDLLDIIDREGHLWKAMQSQESMAVDVIPEALTPDDFALKGILLGDSTETVVLKLGKPISTTQDCDGTSYNYDDIQVIINSHNVVINIITDEWSQGQVYLSVASHRKVTLGSPMKEVIRRYGENFVKTSSDDYDLYEYVYGIVPDQKYILRFAVKQGADSVGYIGCRISQF